MSSIEFQTTVKKIMSAVPKEKRAEFDAHTEDEEVRVIVLTNPLETPYLHKDLLLDAKEKGYSDFLEYLMDNPFEIANPIRFSRDDLHDGLVVENQLTIVNPFNNQ